MAGSPQTVVESLMFPTSLEGPKSMFSLSPRLRVVARRKSPATAATSRAGGAMARNCFIFLSTES